MRIAVVCGPLPTEDVGGTEIQAARMARELARAHEVVLLGRGRPETAAVLEAPGLAVEARQPPGVPGLRLAADVALATRRIARRAPFDAIVCYQTLVAGAIGAMAAARGGAPFAVFVRGRHEYRRSGPARFRGLAPAIYRRADRVLVQSERLAREVLEAFGGSRHRGLRARLEARLRVVPNGVEPGPPREGPGAGFVYVGRLDPGKGVADLIDALRAAPAAAAAGLTVIGDGPERARLEARARGLPVRFAGLVPHERVAERIRTARALVLPSHDEAFPNAVLEAMAQGVAVVATAVGGVPDLVADGASGLLVPPRDPAALAAALARLEDDEALAGRLGRGGREVARTHAWPRVAAQLAAVLEEMRRS